MTHKSGLPPIVYEDDALVAFDKPSGLLVAPDRWDKARENMMDLVHRKYSADCFNAHRLDRETSGVVLCARRKTQLPALCGLFESRAMEKEYVAIVREGPPDDRGAVTLALNEDPLHPGRMVVHPRGKRAETDYQVVCRWRGYARLALRPRTGRTHQLRVHMAALGCPILADAIYGSPEGLFLSRLKPGYKFKKNQEERPLIRRLALHALTLRFTHPLTAAPVEITAPLPKEFGVGIKYLDRFAPLYAPPAVGEVAAVSTR